MSSLRDTLLGKEESNSIIPDMSEYCPSLPYKTRLYVFAATFVLAWLCGVLAGVMIILLRLVAFAVLYSLSNILGLASTFFLVGPAAQLKKMFKPVRLWSAIAFLLFLGLTLFAALFLKNGGLTILFAFIQYCALLWYTLSYMPGARSCFTACCKKTTGLGDDE